MQNDDDTDPGTQPFPADPGEVAAAAKFAPGEVRRSLREGRPEPELAPYAVLLALLWRLRRIHWFARHGTRAVSWLVAAVGLVWLAQRLAG